MGTPVGHMGCTAPSLHDPLCECMGAFACGPFARFRRPRQTGNRPESFVVHTVGSNYLVVDSTKPKPEVGKEGNYGYY
jgi:hypothetical protein